MSMFLNPVNSVQGTSWTHEYERISMSVLNILMGHVTLEATSNLNKELNLQKASSKFIQY